MPRLVGLITLLTVIGGGMVIVAVTLCMGTFRWTAQGAQLRQLIRERRAEPKAGAKPLVATQQFEEPHWAEHETYNEW
jgi:hypothetical protein